MLGWIPQMEGGRPLRILCLGAHADDIEIGCGAALLEMLKVRPLEVRWIVYSGGRTRAEEARMSAAYWLERVSEKTVALHQFRDGFFPAERAAIKAEFEMLKDSFCPDLIFTHFRNDLHQDHRIISELTWNTFRNHSILEYEVPKYDGDLGTPNFYVPVSVETARAKTDALMKYFGSQNAKHWFCEELFLGLMRIRGMECCAPSGYAEAFHARKTCAAF